jgi:uncharacterized membrane protein YdbT with pleckstrin-like domain
MDKNETLYLKRTPSQMVNIGHFALSFLLTITVLGAVIGIPYAIWRYMIIRCTVYEITNQRIKHRHGVFNKVCNELELYRVRDYQVQQPFWLRTVGCGNVIIISSDRTTGELILSALKDSEQIANTIRKLVEQSRRSRGVRDLDTGSAPLFEE